MAKSKKRTPVPPPVLAQPQIIWPKRAKQLLMIGLFMVFLGFIVLTYADPAGQNWASTLSPFFLVLGYALIGVGLGFRKSA